MGIDAGPMPCSCKISFWLCEARCCNVVMPLFCSARLAGVLSKFKKPCCGLFSFSQMGHTGQSLLLKN